MNKCIIKGCSRAAHSRGLCKNCYQAAARLIAQGRVTWPKLARRRLALPAAKRGRKTGASRRALDRALQRSA